MSGQYANKGRRAVILNTTNLYNRLIYSRKYRKFKLPKVYIASPCQMQNNDLI